LALSAIDHHSSCTAPSRSELVRLQQLKEKIRADKCCSHAKSFLETFPSSSIEMTNSDLVENPSLFDSTFLDTKHLIDFPPEFQAIHCKPFLFDLAMLSCEFPSLDSRKTVKKGLFGLGSRFF